MNLDMSRCTTHYHGSVGNVVAGQSRTKQSSVPWYNGGSSVMNPYRYRSVKNSGRVLKSSWSNARRHCYGPKPTVTWSAQEGRRSKSDRSGEHRAQTCLYDRTGSREAQVSQSGRAEHLRYSRR